MARWRVEIFFFVNATLERLSQTPQIRSPPDLARHFFATLLIRAARVAPESWLAPPVAARSLPVRLVVQSMVKKPRFLFASIKWSVDLKSPDEWLADYFLWGETPPSFERVRKIYPQPGSEQEAQALQALLRILRNDQPLSTTIRKRLADLFDPASTAERCIEIGFREKNRPNPAGDAQITAFVEFQEKTGGGREAAVAAAQQQFGMSRSKVYAALARHKQRGLKVPPNHE